MAKKDEIVKQADANIQPYKLQQAISVLRGFPEDFMFRLTTSEANSLIANGGSQIVIPNREEITKI